MKFNIFLNAKSLYSTPSDGCLILAVSQVDEKGVPEKSEHLISSFLLHKVEMSAQCDEVSELHRRSDFTTFKVKMSKLLRISAFQPHAVISPSLSLSSSPTLCLSKSQRRMSLCVCFVSSPQNDDDLNTDIDALKDSPPPV